VLMLAPKSNCAPPAVKKPARMSASSLSLTAGSLPSTASILLDGAATAGTAISTAGSETSIILFIMACLSIQILERPDLVDHAQVAQQRGERLQGDGRGQG